MLYDPKWEKKIETKADPFDLRTLIAWLETQNSQKTYNYGCNGHCLLAQYFTDQGFAYVGMGGTRFSYGPDGNRQVQMLPPHFNRIAWASGKTAPGEYTFGGALKRARAVL